MAQGRKQSVRCESEQYWLAGEDNEVNRVADEVADADNGEYVIELRALLAEVTDEADGACLANMWQ